MGCDKQVDKSLTSQAVLESEVLRVAPVRPPPRRSTVGPLRHRPATLRVAGCGERVTERSRGGGRAGDRTRGFARTAPGSESADRCRVSHA